MKCYVISLFGPHVMSIGDWDLLPWTHAQRCWRETAWGGDSLQIHTWDTDTHFITRERCKAKYFQYHAKPCRKHWNGCNLTGLKKGLSGFFFMVLGASVSCSAPKWWCDHSDGTLLGTVLVCSELLNVFKKNIMMIFPCWLEKEQIKCRFYFTVFYFWPVSLSLLP